MEVKIILLIIWLFIGIVNIICSIVYDKKKVSLWSYSLIWVLLIMCLLERIIVR
jgi:hypothetical protein